MKEPPASQSPAVQAVLHKGLAHHQAGRLNEAVAIYRRILDQLPKDPDALHYLGVALFQGGATEQAIDHLRRAVKGKPWSGEAFNHLGCALLSDVRLEEAENAFQTACILAPFFAAPQFNRATVFAAQGRKDRAVKIFERACVLQPDNAAWRVKLAECLRDTGEFNRASTILDLLVANGGPLPEICFARAKLLDLIGEGARACLDLQRVSMLQPDRVQSLNNLALLYLNDHRTGDAVRSLAHATALQPAEPLVRYNFANALLANGNLKRGWHEFRWRHAKDEVHIDRRGLPREWNGEKLDKGKLLIYQEQGIGDECRFISCLPDAAATAETDCVVESDERLIPLFSRSFPEVEFVGKLPRRSGPPTVVDFSQLIRDKDITAHTAMGDLPRHVRAKIEDFPGDRAYLRADPERRRVWRARFDALPHSKKIGFLWRTGLANPIYDHYFFDILTLAPIFQLADTCCVNLQYDDCEVDLLRAEKELGILLHRPPNIDLKNDLDGLAALISELDLVIGPMTSVVALSGALGTHTIGLKLCADWTELGTGHQPWTPSMHQVVKGSSRSWGEVAEDAAQLVKNFW